ncbi:MAG: hypothetical protein K8I29_10245 [Alphaproteobacteria bacterium]|uniref:Uncharacterized protein n=1 Tax=Candidatus Nitrobium versatile TaxID=2884831 RepID=A0A953M1F4_9BACT|nr:hypothetical protein [Candidatus Nitrobium versatile]
MKEPEKKTLTEKEKGNASAQDHCIESGDKTPSQDDEFFSHVYSSM